QGVVGRDGSNARRHIWETPVRVRLRITQIVEPERVGDQVGTAESLREYRGERSGRRRGGHCRNLGVRRGIDEKGFLRQVAGRIQARGRCGARQQRGDVRRVLRLEYIGRVAVDIAVSVLVAFHEQREIQCRARIDLSQEDGITQRRERV